MNTIIQAARRRQARDIKILKRAIAKASAEQETLATSAYLNLRIRTVEQAQRDIETRRSALQPSVTHLGGAVL
jgi:hypothetical protein